MSPPSLRPKSLFESERIQRRDGDSQGRRTNGGRLDHVADREALDGLVLGCAAGAVGAADGLDVTAAVLVATVCRSLLDHAGWLVCSVSG